MRNRLIGTVLGALFFAGGCAADVGAGPDEGGAGGARGAGGAGTGGAKASGTGGASVGTGGHVGTGGAAPAGTGGAMAGSGGAAGAAYAGFKWGPEVATNRDGSIAACPATVTNPDGCYRRVYDSPTSSNFHVEWGWKGGLPAVFCLPIDDQRKECKPVVGSWPNAICVNNCGEAGVEFTTVQPG